MRNIIKYFVLFCIIISLPGVVNARTKCPVSTSSRIKKLASNITTTYDYQETILDSGYGSVRFTATISNVPSEVYIIRVNENLDNISGKLYSDSNGQIILNNLANGNSYHFAVYIDTPYECITDYFYQFYINIPSYNQFYTSPLCKDYPEYTYCKKWIKMNYTEEEFNSKFNEYISNKKKEENKDPVTPIDDPYETLVNILSFLSKYSFLIFAPIIVLSIIGIIYLKNKDNFDLKIK